MNCQYCQQPTESIHLPEFDDYGAFIRFCHACQAEQLCWSSDEAIISNSLYAKINNRLYRWTVASSPVVDQLGIPFNIVGSLWHVIDAIGYEPGMGTFHTREIANMEHIKTFRGEIAPILTPQNIEQKIRTWLMML